MRRLITVLALTGALAAAACDNQNETNDAEIGTAADVALAPAAVDAAVPAAAPSAVDAPPVDSTTLPPEKRSSEESVKPESETLFY